MNESKSLQERLRENDKSALDFVYREYKEEFINFSLRYDLSVDVLEDIYQDSVIALYQSFVIKQTVLTNSSIKTYLFGIGKNIIFNKFKTDLKTTKLVGNTTEDVEEIKLNFNEPNNEQLLLSKYFNTLGEACKNILNLYYYRGFNIDEIVKSTDYKDSNSVKSIKSRCLKCLKDKIANH